MKNKPFWEKTFAQAREAETFGTPAEELSELVELLPKDAKVLDLGCGEGRNALFLAEKGFDVTAIDISIAGIRKLERLAEEKKFSIKGKIQDMRNFDFQTEFDLIVAHGSLHLIEREHWLSLIRKIQDNTKDGGYNVVVVFTDTLPPPEDLKPFHIGIFWEGELFDFYSDWEIILQRSYILEDEHPGGIRHRHPINKIVTRKIQKN